MPHGMASVLALIPAREQDLLKNGEWIRLCGCPLLDYTLRTARQSKQLTRIIVSTDSAQVAEYARQSGAEVPFLRPKELAARHVPLVRVAQHCLDWLERAEDYRPEVVVLLEVSHPIRPQGLIDKVIESLFQQDLDTVFTAFESHHVYWWMSDTGELSRVEFEEGSTRATRQPLYGQLRGLVCATRADTIRRGALIGRNVGIVPVRGLVGMVDALEEGGLELAEFLLGRQTKERS